MTDLTAVDEAPSERIDPAIEEAARTLLPGSSELIPVGDRPFLVRTTVEGQELRLRRWPDGTIPERVRFVNRLMSVMAEGEPRISAAPYLPEGAKEPLRSRGGVTVDVQHWLPGHPGAEKSLIQLEDEHTLHRPTPISDDRQAALIELVAGMHDRAGALARDRNSPVAPIGQVLRAISQNWRLARVRLRPSAPSYPPIQRWIRLGEQVLPAAEHAILDANLHEKSPVIAHLSLWPAHVLVERADVNGLLDFSAAVATTPLLDIAQLVTRFSGWTGDHAEYVLGRYTEVRPLTPDERRTLPAIAAMDMVIEAARLLRFGYVGELQPGSRQAVAARMGAQDLLNSIEAVTGSVLRAADPVPFAKRRRLTRKAAPPKIERGQARPGRAPKTRRPAKPRDRGKVGERSHDSSE